MPHTSLETPSISTDSSRQTAPVVFVESYPQVIAGQQQTLMSLLETWSEYDIPAVVMVPQEGIYVDELRRRGVEVLVIPQPAQLGRYGGTIYRDGLRTKMKTRLQAVQYIRTLRSELRRRRVRAVFCNDMRGILTAGIAARSLGLPVMTWDKLDKPHGRLDWFELPLLQRTVVIASAVLAKFPDWQVRRYQKRIEIVPDGADLARFDTAESARSELGLSEKDVVIGIVGTVCERKGHDRILAALPQLLNRVPEALVLVVGSWEDDPSHQQFYKTLPNRDHPRVQFLGARSAEKIPAIMHSLDLLAIPSRNEGTPLAIAEAMACGIPVAGANAGGIPEIVADGETGLIFDGNDPEAVLQALTTLCQDPHLRRRMGQAGRVHAERHFNRQVQMRRICELFLEIIPPTP